MRFLVYLIFSSLFFAASIFAQELKLPSNPLDGRIVFEDKGCIFCHSLSGYGGNVGPRPGKKKILREVF